MILVFDAVLSFGLLWIVWSMVRAKSLFQAIALLIAFGTLMALVWARLFAPDIALAEVVVGSAITGTLLLTVFSETEKTAGIASGKKDKRSRVPSIVAFLVCVGVAGVLIFVLLGLPASDPGLRERAMDELVATGVSNPVTATLLAYRGYDTLLEIAVFFMAALSVITLNNPAPSYVSRASSSDLLFACSRVAIPLLVLGSGYLLWIGANAPGGAFQAGSMLGGAMILATLADGDWVKMVKVWQWRLLLVIGLATFVAVGIETETTLGSMLGYRGSSSKWHMLAIEIAVTCSIAFTMMTLVIGSPQSDEKDPTPTHHD